MDGSVCFSFEVREFFENGRFLFAKPPKKRRGFEKRKMECLGLVLCDGVLLGFDLSSKLPDKGGEFSGDGDFDFVVMELALFKHFEAMTEASLSLPGEFFDPSRRAFLPFGKLSADFGWNAVVSGLFDEDPAGVWISAFTIERSEMDRSKATCSAGVRPEGSIKFLLGFVCCHWSFRWEQDQGRP